mmetsp:Transcript_22768/g.37480  ORF Transcript_22768/g.37480 Transcript_22768/m.37480 type:complete len:594 (+) Transcript_22768:68-1849(+)|eukprot:CAMPEP_0184335562 /NCGR_PEP_ID=MMETSP1089-20130417/4105_1 /TAXON_ID=38269 ORGANISM="Gloeochaete wittrockiana, Strain SAG46.84" /NCGR_SAMPLE_ID=MMETSP1089 /ASSEMBLY_ACC=CAM_ASM_000445 /LENGTH=593 /DNA_ID=CAMNT_0026660277 /DNA_START=59 /DNA_END=1840 /DNA_ORIENTATION=+
MTCMFTYWSCSHRISSPLTLDNYSSLGIRFKNGAAFQKKWRCNFIKRRFCFSRSFTISSEIRPIAIKKAQKAVFSCSSCSSLFPQWMGKCAKCDEWGTIEEMEPSYSSGQKNKRSGWIQASQEVVAPVLLTAILHDQRLQQQWIPIPSPLSELQRVLGGGIVRGSLILFSGEPGIGKSTILLQLGGLLSSGPILYVSGEESAHQIALRASRLGVDDQHLYVLNETNIAAIEAAIDKMKPAVLFVDSIQTITDPNIMSSAGSVTQVRECAQQFLQIAKGRHGLSIILAGHVTKSGLISGPKVLEHIVDVIVTLTGDRLSSFRLLRATKNRFGSTNEIGVLEMTSAGMQDVTDPFMLLDDQPTLPGSAMTICVEGTRALVMEIQSLAAKAMHSSSRRTSSGVDMKRLYLLLAVLYKHVGIQSHQCDVYINVTRGMKITDPSADLAICTSIVSSILEKPVRHATALIGEVGLGGELRVVSQLEKRVKEAAMHGFSRIIVPYTTEKMAYSNTEIIPVRTLKHALAEAIEDGTDFLKRNGRRPKVQQKYRPRKPEDNMSNERREWSGVSNSWEDGIDVEEGDGFFVEGFADEDEEQSF